VELSVKRAFLFMASSIVAVAALSTIAVTEETMDHKLMTPEEIQWGAGPPSLPAGAQATVLYGDPSKEGLFAMRLKFPKGYVIPPHTHPKPEVVTVISGTFRLGVGETGDASQAKALTAGSFIALSPGTAHFAAADEDTVVQLNSFGPWAVNYVNPKDDPRQKTE
jgi:quercetin dioxygenase-like cupin family protein